MRARTLALAIAAGAATAVAFALARLKRPGTAGPRATPPAYTCACGQQFRAAGAGRHRVYWRAGAPEDDPVLSPNCPGCDRPLPREADLQLAQSTL